MVPHGSSINGKPGYPSTRGFANRLDPRRPCSCHPRARMSSDKTTMYWTATRTKSGSPSIREQHYPIQPRDRIIFQSDDGVIQPAVSCNHKRRSLLVVRLHGPCWRLLLRQRGRFGLLRRLRPFCSLHSHRSFHRRAARHGEEQLDVIRRGQVWPVVVRSGE